MSAVPTIDTEPSGKSVDGQCVSSGAFDDLYMSMPRTSRLAAGPWFAIREIIVIVATFFGYEQVRHLTRDDKGAAFSNARRVVDTERALHVFGEHGIQNLAMRFDGLIQFLNHYYVFVHFPLSFTFVGWVVFRHRDLYPRFRNWFGHPSSQWNSPGSTSSVAVTLTSLIAFLTSAGTGGWSPNMAS